VLSSTSSRLSLASFDLFLFEVQASIVSTGPKVASGKVISRLAKLSNLHKVKSSKNQKTLLIVIQNA